MRVFTTKPVQGGGKQAAPINEENREPPVCGPQDVLVDIRAIGVNRADFQMRRNAHPEAEKNPDEEKVPGVELAGVVTRVGEKVTRLKVGDKICSTMAGGEYSKGGAYAEQVVLPEYYPLKMPDGMSFQEAASIPMGLATAWHNLFENSSLEKEPEFHYNETTDDFDKVDLNTLNGGRRVLIHGGAGGVGTLAIQLARAMGVGHISATVITEEQRERLTKEFPYVEAILVPHEGRAKRGDKTVTAAFEKQAPADGQPDERYDVILDVVGAPYFGANINSLKPGGWLRIIGFQGGTTIGPKDAGINLWNVLTEAVTNGLNREFALHLVEKGREAEIQTAGGKTIKVGDDIIETLKAARADDDPIFFGGDRLREMIGQPKEPQVNPKIRAQAQEKSEKDLMDDVRRHVMPLVRDGKIKPQVSTEYPFSVDGIEQAHHDILGHHFGRGVLVVQNEVAQAPQVPDAQAPVDTSSADIYPLRKVPGVKPDGTQ